MTNDHKEKTVMGKDDNGVFHPGKGKPSGYNKEEGLGLQATESEDLEEYFDVTEKYTASTDELADHVKVAHPNRNTSKGEVSYTGKKPKAAQASDEELVSTIVEQLPGVLTKDRFSELANFKDGVTVSLYFATASTGGEGNEQFDSIAFKSALNTAEQTLKKLGHNQVDVVKLLQPAQDFINDKNLWKNLSKGLAVFIADGFFKYIKMPVTPEPKVVVESSFYVTPLIPLITSNEYFYLLVMSKQGVKLFKADAFGMQYMAVELPQSIEEVKRLSDLDATTYRRGESGKRAAEVAQPGQSHGGGGGNVDGKDNIATYFEAVDDILWEKVFNKENAPLLLAGVEYEIPIYKSVCDYHNVWEQPLTGNRSNQETQALYQDAMEVMAPYFKQKTVKALEQYGNKSATALTSSIVTDVVPATYYGRVSHLFVAKGVHVYGIFDEMNNQLTIHDIQQADSEDLLDNAVVKTLATGGEVYLLDKEEMPADSAVAALFRY